MRKVYTDKYLASRQCLCDQAQNYPYSHKYQLKNKLVLIKAEKLTQQIRCVEAVIEAGGNPILIGSNINKLTTNSKAIFKADDIIKGWTDLSYTKDISYHKITMKVSSGYYIRMIPYYIYRDLGICSHVMNINRIDT